MQEIQIFENPEFGAIRTTVVDGEPWFVGKDIAVVLGYEKPTDAVRKHVDQEDRGVSKMETPSGEQTLAIINESGLYSLVLTSKLPTAKRFKRWVTSEVLPSIRKHGGYLTAEKIEAILSDPRVAVSLANALQAEQAKTAELTREVGKLRSEHTSLVLLASENKKKAVIADAVSDNPDFITIGDMAKLIRQAGIEIGQTRLLAWLRREKYLICRRGPDYNMPTQDSIERGVMRLVEMMWDDGENGSHTYCRRAMITGKGQAELLNIFTRLKDQIPV